MFGCRLDRFAIAGSEGEPMPETDDQLEIRAYQLGRDQAGIAPLKVITETKVEQRPRESYKTLGIVGA